MLLSRAIFDKMTTEGQQGLHRAFATANQKTLSFDDGSSIAVVAPPVPTSNETLARAAFVQHHGAYGGVREAVLAPPLAPPRDTTPHNRDADILAANNAFHKQALPTPVETTGSAISDLLPKG